MTCVAFYAELCLTLRFRLIVFNIEMSRKRKELPIVENVEITDVAAEGNSIARIEGLATFIPFGAPGDVADIKIVRKIMLKDKY